MDWILYIVLTTVTPRLEIIVELGSYPTEVACELQRAYVTMEMMKAYPGDTDYSLKCVKKVK